jgi:hypothetical protein
VTLQILRNAGWAIVPIHYSLDPEKTEAWAAHEKERYRASGLPNPDGVWQREMEIDFSATAGALAYPNYHESIHCVPGEIPVQRGIPLCLWMDFNVAPMVWGVAQIVHGWLNCIRTFSLEPATIALMCVEFRNLYPSHSAELWIYGDAAGHSRTSQTAQSDYDLVRIGLVGYNVPIVHKVPIDNPDEKDRLNAVNTKLKPPDGMPGMRISKPNCPHLVADFEQVVLNNRGKLAKTYDFSNPYSKLTHASDGVGYLISREWPVAKLVSRPAPKAKPLKYDRLLGDL